NQKLDMSLLDVISSFLEDAPIFLLQTYIVLLTRREFTWTFAEIKLVFNTFKSVVMLAKALKAYRFNLHFFDISRAPLPMCASLGLFAWSFFILIARVLVLALFATTFKAWIALVFALDIMISYLILFNQDCNYFPNSKLKLNLFKLFLAYVHLFAFFHLEGRQMRRFAYPYYAFVFFENVILMLLW
ncbi:predicted protein, partial [Nematostella vectensis]